MTAIFNPGQTGPTGSVGPSYAGGLIELSYNERTSPVTVTASTEATAQVLVTASSITFGAGAVQIEFFCPSVGLPGNVTVILYDNTAGASLGFWGLAGTGPSSPLHLIRRLVPGAGARVYSARAYVDAGSAGFAAGTAGAGLYVPMFIRITG